MAFKRELLFHSVVGQQEQPQPWVPLSPYTKLLVGDVDLFLVSFSRKKDFPRSVLAQLKFFMVPSCFWITCSSARNQVPSEDRSRRGCLTGNAESRSAADTALFDHYCIMQCRYSVPALEVEYLPPSQSYFLRLSLTLCLGVWVLESLFCAGSQSCWLSDLVCAFLVQELTKWAD